jgi:hypothetical protein
MCIVLNHKRADDDEFRSYTGYGEQEGVVESKKTHSL